MLIRNSLKIFVRIHNENQRRYASDVAFIGLGNMGARMVNNLVKKGTSVNVYDISPTAAAALKGVTVSSSVADAVRDAPIVITMLPNGDVVKQTLQAPDGILAGAAPNTLLIDSSTIEPTAARDISSIAAGAGLRFVDAPVSGGIVGAAAGTLAFMVGGAADDVRGIESLLLQMGAKVFHCGGVGAGQVAKICNNLILGATMVATSEAFNIGIKSGLDAKILASIVNVSTGRSWTSDTYNPVPGIIDGIPPSNNYDGGFLVKLIAKDLGLAENAALACNTPVPITALTHQIYRTILAQGYGDKDFAYVYQFLKGQ